LPSFLEKVVVPRGNLKKGGRGDGEVLELNIETILQYIKVVVDFHACQASKNLVERTKRSWKSFESLAEIPVI
jgi:hypothetical protein